MTKDAKTIREELARPFAPEDLEWRIQVTSKDKTSGLAIPYVTNRAIQDRLDEVVGPENWYNDYKPWHGNGKKDAQICGISIYFEGKGFITKWDGAEDSDIEPIKGGLSDSMKRAAVQWGVGRVLYKMTKPLWVRIEQKGNSYVICDTERPKLNAAYLELLDKLHQLPTSPGAAQAQLSYKRDAQPPQQVQPQPTVVAPQAQPSAQQPLPFTRYRLRRCCRAVKSARRWQYTTRSRSEYIAHRCQRNSCVRCVAFLLDAHNPDGRSNLDVLRQNTQNPPPPTMARPAGSPCLSQTVRTLHYEPNQPYGHC